MAEQPYPPIADYALIGDCHTAALVSRSGSIDWCCFPRFDSGSYFGRLLSWDNGGFCSLGPAPTRRQAFSSRRYLRDTLVLETTFDAGGGEARLIDFFAMRKGGARDPYQQIVRIVEGVRGRVRFQVDVCPRFDYAEVKPWIRKLGPGVFSAIGGNDALVIWSDFDLTTAKDHDLNGEFTVAAGERLHLSLQYMPPEDVDRRHTDVPTPEVLDGRLDETVRWWRGWRKRAHLSGPFEEPAIRSAIVLKSMQNAPTGGIVAAPSTSLPEAIGGGRNWDYRFSWVRDSAFVVRSLVELGCQAEADGFRRFIERSAASGAEDLQIVFGVGGERRLMELAVPEMEGYRRSSPVRVGNNAATQFQADVYGWLLLQAWDWHQLGHSPDDDYWRFLVSLVDCAAQQWRRPDAGIWELRGSPRHFVHSKAMCWAAADIGLKLAGESSRKAPEQRWRRTAREIRKAVERDGYDRRRGIFVESFGSRSLDAALLLLPISGFVEWQDERMVRTTDAIREKLEDGGLLRRYERRDGLGGREGAFLACSFWLAECLARQDRLEEAREVFDRAMSTGNDLGLFSEEYDTSNDEMLGNFPQGLTHLSHVAAAVALTEAANRLSPS
jgi:GH15 family glucan-1,4-alpha-glucosidase